MSGLNGRQDEALQRNRLRVSLIIIAAAIVVLAAPRHASAQTIRDVVSFLLINRSVATGDFVRDDQAAIATRDTIAQFLVTELGTLPISSSAGGFTYRLNPELGVSVRSSESFGPFFTERSLTIGSRGLAFALSYRQSSFNEIDGRDLGNGTLVTTAARLRNETQPFDVETLSLKLRTDTTTLFANYGVMDRIDMSAALPLIRMELSGTHVDTYRGTSLIQATASGSAIGPGDLVLRGKYNAVRTQVSGIALALEARLPTGDEDNLLGTGEMTLTPRFIASWEDRRVGLHGNFGAMLGGESNDLEYRGAFTWAVAPGVTLVGEAMGRRLEQIGQLTEVMTPHPQLANVDTIRLSTSEDATNRLVIVGGLKWNVASTWLLSINVLKSTTSSGLTARWTPAVTLDYSLGR